MYAWYMNTLFFYIKIFKDALRFHLWSENWGSFKPRIIKCILKFSCLSNSFHSLYTIYDHNTLTGYAFQKLQKYIPSSRFFIYCASSLNLPNVWKLHPLFWKKLANCVKLNFPAIKISLPKCLKLICPSPYK